MYLCIYTCIYICIYHLGVLLEGGADLHSAEGVPLVLEFRVIGRVELADKLHAKEVPLVAFGTPHPIHLHIRQGIH